MKRLIKMNDDVFVLPSHREGFGSAMIEANACGIPVMASHIYGLTDAEVHGQTGILVTCCEPGDLSRAIKKVGKHWRLWARMMGGRPKSGQSLFPPNKKISGALLQFYRKIISVH